VDWACRKGRAAIFADCGLGKTPMQLVWAENVVRKTNGRVLILTPLAVAFQTVREGEKFGIECTHRREGVRDGDKIVVTNYERLHHFDPNDFAGVVCDESSILKNLDGKTRKAVTDFMRKRPYRLLCTATAAPNDYNGEFRLPPLKVRQHVVKAAQPRDGYLFDLPAVGLAEQRSDLRRTIAERCDMAAELCNAHDRPAVAWCNLNEEGKRLARAINGAVEVSGNDSEDHKEYTFNGFVSGDVRVLVTKPVIGGFGLNLQHCAHQTYFASHSYEQYYQSVRRCWRFGQTQPVTVDMITTDGQQQVLANLQRKADAAAKMFDQLVAMMRNELNVEKRNGYTKAEEIPSWL